MRPLKRLLHACPLLGVLALLASCGRSDPGNDLQLPPNTTVAARMVEEAFADAPPQVQDTVVAARNAVHTGDYEKAVVALQSLKETPQPSLDQGLAIHGYMVTLESELIHAAASGDERAKRAYELLRRMRRN